MDFQVLKLTHAQNMLGIRFQSTVGLVQQARAQDDGWFDTFVNSVDSAAPAPAGEFSSAYQRRDFAQVNAMANSVLQSQSSVSAIVNKFSICLYLPLRCYPKKNSL